MFSKSRDVEAIAAELPGFTDPSVPMQACCCPARPVVKVIMPPTSGRPHPVDLWLCGHHYRASLAALVTANASVNDLTVASDQPPVDRVTAEARP